MDQSARVEDTVCLPCSPGPICGDALDVRQVRVGKEITDLACHRVGELWAAGHLDAGDSEKLPLADWKHDVDFILAARRQGGFHAHREVT